MEEQIFHEMIEKDINDLIELLQSMSGLNSWKEKLANLSGKVYKSFCIAGKLMIMGNGGSAAQAQHIAAEFINRFMHERRALPALSLTVDTSNITSISNDYDFANIFERQIEALGRKGDVLLCLSTSGNSPNIVRALKKAKFMGIYCFSFLGRGGGLARDYSDDCIIVDSPDTPRIQEVHDLLGHILCRAVEEAVINEK